MTSGQVCFTSASSSTWLSYADLLQYGMYGTKMSRDGRSLLSKNDKQHGKRESMRSVLRSLLPKHDEMRCEAQYDDFLYHTLVHH